MFEEIQSLWHYYDPARPINVLMAGYSYCDKTYCIEREDSDIIQFEYVYDGTGTLEIDGQVLHPSKNDIYTNNIRTLFKRVPIFSPFS